MKSETSKSTPAKSTPKAKDTAPQAVSTKTKAAKAVKPSASEKTVKSAKLVGEAAKASKPIKVPKAETKKKSADESKASGKEVKGSKESKAPKGAKLEKSKLAKSTLLPKKEKTDESLIPAAEPLAKMLDSKVVYEGKLFRVLQDHLIEPGGRESHRDVIKHNGSVVILAVNPGKHKKNPWIVIERQYRHAAGQYLWELPAGKLDVGEDALEGAKRELAEETGYSSKEWSPLVEYFASPGFLGEAMKVYLAEELVAGDAHPEDDEHIDFRLVKLSEVMDLIDKGEILDGKTLVSVLLYARKLGVKRKK